MSVSDTRRGHSPPAIGRRHSVLGEPWAAMLSLVDRLPFARGWNRRPAHVTLAILGLSTLGTLMGPQGKSFPFLVLACGAFALLIVMEAHRPSLDRQVVLWTSLALLVAAVVAPPRDSGDVWSYAMYGRMVTHYHADPYRISPQAFSGDIWFWRVSVWWQDTKTVYGPLFTAISSLGMRFAGDSVVRARLFFQFLTAASVGGAVALLYRRKLPAGALAFLGLSPLVVVNIANGAHNDALVGFAVLLAILSLTRSRTGRWQRWRVGAGLALGLGALIKLIAVLPAGAIVLWLWRREGHRRALMVAGIMVGVVVVGYVFSGGVGALAPLQEASRLVDHFSLYGWFGHLIPPPKLGQGPLGGLLVSPVPKGWLTGWARLVPTLLVGGLAALMMLAGSSDSRPSAGASAAVLGFVLAASYIQPWYVAAMMPLLALQWRSRLAFLGAGYALVLMLAETWQSSDGLVRTILKVPLSTIFPVYQLLTLAALAWLALRQLRGEPLRLRSLLQGDLLREDPLREDLPAT